MINFRLEELYISAFLYHTKTPPAKLIETILTEGLLPYIKNKLMCTMKQLSKAEKEQLEKKFLKIAKETGFETDEGIFYPDFCELGTIYSPEECKKLGILI